MHYQYKLGILPKKNNTRPRYSAELRKAIRHIDEISNQTILLCKHNISTIGELNLFLSTVQEQMDNLISKRRQCFYKIRRCKTKMDKDVLKEEAKSYTPRIRELRKQVRLCEGIKERSNMIRSIDFEVNKEKNKYRRL